MIPAHNYPYQEIQDANHIRTLAIFHCVYGGLSILGGIGLLIATIAMLHFVSPMMGAAMSSATWPASGSTYITTSGPGSLSTPAGPLVPAVPGVSPSPPSGYTTTTTTFTGSTSAGPGAPPPDFGNMMSTMMNIYAFFYGGLGVLLLVLGILCLVSARKMSQRKAQTFSLVIAGINCLSFPLGTTLGVFTFVVLLRPSVAAEYQRAATEPPTTPGPSNP